jgi:signal transduction histidine kinase
MVTNISGELRKRQREVVVLQEKGLREKTKELKEASKELAKLEEGRKHLLRFLAIASHDLKAPLSAVQSYLQVMLGGFVGKITEKQKHMVERSSQRITELLGLISDLLDISRIEGGQIVSEMEEVSLGEVVENATESVRVLAKDKKIGLHLEVPKSLPKLKASGVRLQQVITNLLTNAIKFTPEKGEIRLRATEGDGEVRVEVLDTGAGITAEDLPKIFDDFYRGGDTEKAGTGLGLSIVRRVVEAHGGKIWAESPNPEDKSGRGSKFTFTLPMGLTPVAGKQKKRNTRRGR